MARTVAYAETLRLIPPSDSGVSVEVFKRALTALGTLGVARHVLPSEAGATEKDLEKAAEATLLAIEGSPVPEAEWGPMSDILGDDLAGLLGISGSSLARYRSGERVTPDLVAARLHMLTLIVSDLAGSYNEFGIRRWIRRPRTALGGRAPNEILTGGWEPDADDISRVRALAHNLLGAAGG